MVNDPQPAVLFRPEVERLRNDRQRAWFGKPQLVEYPDHIEYFDGRRTHRWRLAGQRSELPELTRILIAGVRFPVSTQIANYTIGLYDDQDTLLSRVSFRPRLNFEQFEATLPDSAFTGLIQRGVQVERVTYNDGPHLYREHPEFTSGTAARRYLQHPARWLIAAFVLLFVVVGLIQLATGHFS